MMKVKGIFAVSLIAMMVVGGAYAEIASSGYVDEKIDGLATVAKTGAYGDLSGAPTVNNATLTIQKNGTSAGTFTANASANRTINITVPTKTSELNNDSGFITSANLPVATANTLGGVKSGGDITVATSGAVTVNSANQADTATTATSATKATQDASGNVITSTYATKTELSAKQNASTAVEVATAGTAVGDSTHPVYVNASGVATKIDKVAAAAKADTATSATTAASATKATQDGNGANIADTYAKKTELPTVNNATLTIQKNGTNVATFTANSASAATANITVPTKTSELTNDSNYATTTQVNARVATAQGTDNANDVMVVNSSGNVTPALITNANISSSAAIAQSKISGLTDALAEKLSTTGTAAKATADAKGNNIADTYATKSQINALDSTSTGTGAVVTGVSQTDGKVSVTKGNVQIPVGSATATSYATIWVQ